MARTAARRSGADRPLPAPRGPGLRRHEAGIPRCVGGRRPGRGWGQQIVKIGSWAANATKSGLEFFGEGALNPKATGRILLQSDCIDDLLADLLKDDPEQKRSVIARLSSPFSKPSTVFLSSPIKSSNVFSISLSYFFYRGGDNAVFHPNADRLV